MKNNKFSQLIHSLICSLLIILLSACFHEKENEAPVFLSPSSIEIRETEQITILLKASDSENNAITFAISGGDDKTLFQINSETGELIFKDSPVASSPSDANSDGIYVVEISVSDDNSTSTKKFEIKILPSPNKSPFFTSVDSFTVEDNETFVATIAVEDPDNDNLSFEIVGSEDADFFVIDAKTGELRFKNLLDADYPSNTLNDNAYKITIGVRDGRYVIFQDIKITLTRTPDREPRFYQYLFDLANPLRGGRLYDNWWREKSIQKPSAVNPIWVEVFAANPENTNGNESQWRCKECHGWDYKGSAGAYGLNSSHYTGIRGLNNANPQFTAEHVFRMIILGSVPYRPNGSTILASNLKHQFTGNSMMNVSDAYDLAKFVMEKANQDQANPTAGDIASGAAVFESVSWGCGISGCHTPTATLTPKLSDIVEVAQTNPQEFLHKVRYGSPGSLMPDGLDRIKAQDVRAFVAVGAIPNEVPSSDFIQATYDVLGANDVVAGGKLYDKWWQKAASSTEPLTTQPNWPASNTAVSGSATWRCKACHGWDYRGADGAYATGKYATNIQGIVTTTSFIMQYSSAANVYGFLKTNSSHGFTTIFTTGEFYQLTKFIMTMRTEVAASQSGVNFINDSSKLTKDTDIVNGKTLYNSANIITCSNAGCHGEDGEAFDFADGDPANPPNEFVHHIAKENPWKFIHKIRFGQPNYIAMPALYAATSASENTTQAATDILAYAQTNLVSNIKRAGLLYDKWWHVEGIKDSTVPVNRNATWVDSAGTEDITKVSNSATWRCKECHGWDYQGVHGAYGYDGDTTGKHYSGIRGYLGPLQSREKADSVLFDAIKMGTARTQLSDHDFGRFLSDSDIQLLVDFIKDSDASIPTSVDVFENLLTMGDATLGKVVYETESPGNCLTCHGASGSMNSTVDISNIANSDPQKFLHKVRYGHPNSSMLPVSKGFSGLTQGFASNVLAYVKSLNPGNGEPDPIYSYNTADPVRGGRLYDKWWMEMQATDDTVRNPIAMNPLWATKDATVSDFPDTWLANKQIESSWRCKTCHAWNYKGIGFNVGEPDNLINKIALRQVTFPDAIDLQNYLYNWIKNGLGNADHKFGEVLPAIPSALGERELWDLVRFLLDGGVIDTSSNIVVGIAIGVDTDNGLGLYVGSKSNFSGCIACHGSDGKTSPPIDQGGSGDALDIFTIAASGGNPWEYLHKVRFGQPGTSMPAIFGTGSLTDQDAFDLLGYGQQQFNAR